MKNHITSNPPRPGTGTWEFLTRTLAMAGLLAALLLPARLHSQTEPSALVEFQSTDKGFLLPRMTQAQRDAIAGPATGLMVYNTTTGCLDVNFGSPAAPIWQGGSCSQGAVAALDCGGAMLTGTPTSGQPVDGVFAMLPYTGGNGGSHPGQSVASTGVKGLLATLPAGSFANGDDSLAYVITGVPDTVGTASFALDIGGQSCTLAVAIAPGAISSLNCNGAAFAGTMTPGQPAVGVFAIISYAGGNGGAHPGQVVTSTGVAGLTATLAAGSFANGSGNLAYAITGTPAINGTPSFALNIGGLSCSVMVSVTPRCGANVAAGQWKEFLCHNLGVANPGADPFTPSWEIIGGYWQWGRWQMAVSGPSGPGAGQANDAAVSGWNTSDAPNGSWQDGMKTANDPCPNGFRVPTKTQWDGVRNHNTQSITGTWASSPTNYSSGRFFGPALMLPAAGYRFSDGGQLFYRGSSGYYWSSTEGGTGDAWFPYFSSGGAGTNNSYRRVGFSLRCLAE